MFSLVFISHKSRGNGPYLFCISILSNKCSQFLLYHYRGHYHWNQSPHGDHFCLLYTPKLLHQTSLSFLTKIEAHLFLICSEFLMMEKSMFFHSVFKAHLYLDQCAVLQTCIEIQSRLWMDIALYMYFYMHMNICKKRQHDFFKRQKLICSYFSENSKAHLFLICS